MSETIHTVLDAPAPSISGCHYCNPKIKDVGLCDACFAAIDARVNALLGLPAVVTILGCAERLTEAERLRLNQACLDNFQVNRLPQLHLHHRVTRAYGRTWRDLLDADGRIFRRFEATFGPYNFALHAVNDAVFAAMVGDLLDADEARLFTKPWLDITT